jgi:NAD+ dependent glucose-6-phosphate dehydrogenase
VFASSNWVMAGRRFADGPLTTDQEPYPINAYGVSKLVGERLGRSYSERWGLSVICFRIGYNQRDHDNRPGPQMAMNSWGQLMWLSDRDLCGGFEAAVAAPASVRFAVLNLMSDNPGMRWDLQGLREVLDFRPADGAAPVVSETGRAQEDSARKARQLIEAIKTYGDDQRW